SCRLPFGPAGHRSLRHDFVARSAERADDFVSAHTDRHVVSALHVILIAKAQAARDAFGLKLNPRRRGPIDTFAPVAWRDANLENFPPVIAAGLAFGHNWHRKKI